MARILVVDDDTSLRQMVRVMLEREGHQVIVASNGDEGLAAALGQSPDLAVVDLMMPGMSGHTLTRALRGEPRTAQIPVLILTARGQNMDRQLALDAGANAYLAKPVTSKDLIGLINELLAKAAADAASSSSAPGPLTSPSTPPVAPTSPPISTTQSRRPIGASDALIPTPSALKLPLSNAPSNATNQGRGPGQLPVITVIGLRGGSGTTTVAVNLAALMHTRRGRVCLIDLGMTGGHVGLHFHMAALHSWGDLISAGDSPDPKQIGSILMPHPSTGLTVLAAPRVPSMVSLSQTAAIHVLNVLGGGFGQLVIDADTLTPAVVGALLASHAIVVVTGDDIMAVHTTSHMMQTLQKLGLEMGRVRIAVNHSRQEPGVPTQTIQKALGRPISAEIPYDPNQTQAVRKGTPLVSSDPQSPFAAAIQQLLKTV